MDKQASGKSFHNQGSITINKQFLIFLKKWHNIFFESKTNTKLRISFSTFVWFARK